MNKPNVVFCLLLLACLALSGCSSKPTPASELKLTQPEAKDLAGDEVFTIISDPLPSGLPGYSVVLTCRKGQDVRQVLVEDRRKKLMLPDYFQCGREIKVQYIELSGSLGGSSFVYVGRPASEPAANQTTQ